MTRPFTSKEILKSIGLGVLKGIIYYIVFYVLLLGVITYYLIPYILSMGNIEIKDPAVFTGYVPLNYMILTWFLVLSIIGSILTRHIPYGSPLMSIISLALLYIVLLSINFGRFTGYVEELDSNYSVDLSPLMYRLFYLIIFLTIGGACLGVAKEYKRRTSLKQ